MLLKLFFGLTGLLCSKGLQRRRSQAAQLRAMSDLELRDLGMGRSEIPGLLSVRDAERIEERWGNRHLS